MEEQVANQISQPSKPITPEMIIDAVHQENRSLYQRIYELEMKLNPLIRLFEIYFKEELDRRVGGKERDFGEGACAISPLEQLKYNR